MKKILLPLAIGSLLLSSAAMAQSDPYENLAVSQPLFISADAPEARFFLSLLRPPTGSQGRHTDRADQLSCIRTGKWLSGKGCHG